MENFVPVLEPVVLRKHFPDVDVLQLKASVFFGVVHKTIEPNRLLPISELLW